MARRKSRDQKITEAFLLGTLKSHDQRVAEAFVLGTLLPVLHASSDNGEALQYEIVTALFGQVAFEDGNKGDNDASGLLEFACQVVRDGRDAGEARRKTCSDRALKRKDKTRTQKNNQPIYINKKFILKCYTNNHHPEAN